MYEFNVYVVGILLRDCGENRCDCAKNFMHVLAESC